MIMILTGKCEEDFIKYASYNYGEDSGDLAMMHSVMRNALIIEFFDSVGIYIETFNEFGAFGISIHKGDYRNPIESIGHWNSRQEATEQAIINANKIYNENKV